jgi:hypothetical protein
MERRLARLATVYAVDARAVTEASWSIQWALQYPGLDPDMAAWAARIWANHDIDDAGLRRAAELALTRCGLGREDARQLGELPLETLLDAAGAAAAEGTR